MEIEVRQERPHNFSPSVEVAGAFLCVNDHFLLLKREKDKPYPLTWGLPGGKIDTGETSKMGIIREIQEEVGLSVIAENLNEVCTLYITQEEIQFTFDIYHANLDIKPSVKLSEGEHCDFLWCTYLESLELDLISGGIETMKICYPLFK
ncbi:MAG: NUDIX hydrolase [Rhabdochlamydiaceae bacterium]|nr:NUDIX hydrolase [Candidatus Amphrikana amoebophyrae]